MSGVQAVNFEEIECGKKIQGTKKRFKWKFNVDGQTHTLELASSTFSGKKIVTYDMLEIHSEQSILNVDFDFVHNIEGHVFRISRVPDNFNKFELRIDNQDFQEMVANKGSGKQIKSEKSIYKKEKNDPFSQFAAASLQSIPKASTNNEFGQFDFDSFSNNPPPPQKTQSTKETKLPPAGPSSGSNKNFDFDFSAPPAPKATSQNYQTINLNTNNLQTNNFQTNNNPNQFFQNFNKFDIKANDEDCFATNAYNKNNLYSDLMYSTPEEKKYYAKFNKPPEEEEEEEPKQKPGFLAEKISNIKVEMSAKQVLNKVKQTAESIKMKVTGQEESLI